MEMNFPQPKNLIKFKMVKLSNQMSHEILFYWPLDESESTIRWVISFLIPPPPRPLASVCDREYRKYEKEKIARES